MKQGDMDLLSLAQDNSREIAAVFALHLTQDAQGRAVVIGDREDLLVAQLGQAMLLLIDKQPAVARLSLMMAWMRQFTPGGRCPDFWSEVCRIGADLFSTAPDAPAAVVH